MFHALAFLSAGVHTRMAATESKSRRPHSFTQSMNIERRKAENNRCPIHFPSRSAGIYTKYAVPDVKETSEPPFVHTPNPEKFNGGSAIIQNSLTLAFLSAGMYTRSAAAEDRKPPTRPIESLTPGKRNGRRHETNGHHAHSPFRPGSMHTKVPPMRVESRQHPFTLSPSNILTNTAQAQKNENSRACPSALLACIPKASLPSIERHR